MTENYSSSIFPDGITGMIFAMEGIRNTIVLLNGPMGCRFYHSTTSQFLSIRPLLYLPSDSGVKVPVDYNYLNNWFFRQQRVPCTYLDGHDYVYGTEEKVREAILYIKKHIDFAMLAVINSPGASLIGDRLLEIVHELVPDRTAVLLESPGFSVDYDYGYEQACLQLLAQNAEKFNRKGSVEPARVNILGLSIWDRYFEGDRAEIARMLEKCGLKPGCFLAADCSMEEIRELPKACLNIVLNPQRGLAVAGFLRDHYGTPFYAADSLPVGFEASERFCEEICSHPAVLGGADATPVIGESRRARAYAWYKIEGLYRTSGLPKGAFFAVEGSFAQVYAFSSFLMNYLGMLPDSLSVCGEMQPSMRAALRKLLSEFHCESAMEKPLADTDAQLVFADANAIAALMTRKEEQGKKNVFCGIEISLPGMGYTDLVPKTHLGVKGAMFLTEQVLNGLMTRL